MHLTQKAIDGMDKKTVERLHPINDVKKPNKNEPKITPIAPIDPIQLSSWTVSLPLNNGVFSEANLGREGATLK